jgi:hypothetical protein
MPQRAITPATVHNTSSSSGQPSADPALVRSFQQALAADPPTPCTAVPLSIVLEIDGGSAAITDGTYGWISRLAVPVRIFDVTLQNVRGETGSLGVDIQTCTPGDAPTWSSICGSSLPAISGGQYYHDATLSGWSPVLPRGTGIRAVLSGSATFSQISIALGARRTDLSAQT